MPFYQLKPTVVKALQVTHDNMEELKQWLGAVPYTRPPTRRVDGITFFCQQRNEELVAMFGSYVVYNSEQDMYYVMSEPGFKHLYQPIT